LGIDKHRGGQRTAAQQAAQFLAFIQQHLGGGSRCWAAYCSTVSGDSPWLTQRKRTSGCSRWACSRAGISRRHGGHQVAQRLMTRVGLAAGRVDPAARCVHPAPRRRRWAVVPDRAPWLGEALAHPTTAPEHRQCPPWRRGPADGASATALPHTAVRRSCPRWRSILRHGCRMPPRQAGRSGARTPTQRRRAPPASRRPAAASHASPKSAGCARPGAGQGIAQPPGGKHL
jgi:hypothetical protein